MTNGERDQQKSDFELIKEASIGLRGSIAAELADQSADHGVATLGNTSNVRRFAFACPALPTCGLAVTESERVMPHVISELEAVLTELRLDDEQFAIHMTGFPNGCARPYNCDIGLVGRSIDGKSGEGKYTIFVGGSLLGNRMNRVYKDLVLRSELVAELRPLLVCFRDHRNAGESLGDFLERWGIQALEQFASNQPAS